MVNLPNPIYKLMTTASLLSEVEKKLFPFSLQSEVVLNILKE